MKKYLPRYTDQELKESLEYMGAVLITGPKWCGKITTAKQQCKSLKELQHPVHGKSYLKLADTNPMLLPRALGRPHSHITRLVPGE